MSDPVETLQALINEYDESTPPCFSELLERVRTVPVPFATQIGEQLQVYSQRIGHSPGELCWRFVIVGERSGEQYTEVWVTICDRDHDVPDIPLELFGLTLRIALHHPADVDDEIFIAFRELANGVAMFRCHSCGCDLPTYALKVAHDSLVHDTPGIDTRPALTV